MHGEKDAIKRSIEHLVICSIIFIAPLPLLTLAKEGYVFGSVGLSVCLCLSVSNITQKLRTDWDEILWRDPGWYSEELITFWC